MSVPVYFAFLFVLSGASSKMSNNNCDKVINTILMLPPVMFNRSLVPRRIGICWPLLANQIEGQTNECKGLRNLKHSSTYFHCDQESHLVVDVPLS